VTHSLAEAEMGVDKYPIRIFDHTPKCGGTSVLKVLGNWFDLYKDYITVDQLRGNEPLNPPFFLSAFNSNSCVCGHFETPRNSLFTRYPEIRKNPELFQVFSLVREPLELRASLYYYEIMTGRRNQVNSTFSDFLREGSNFLADQFACSLENYKEVMDCYVFIGVQEQLQESVDILAALFKKPTVELEKLNVSPRAEHPLGLTEIEMEWFRDNNKLDYLIYEYAKSKLARILASTSSTHSRVDSPAGRKELDAANHFHALERRRLHTTQKRNALVRDSLIRLRATDVPIGDILDMGIVNGTPVLRELFADRTHHLFLQDYTHVQTACSSYANFDYRLANGDDSAITLDNYIARGEARAPFLLKIDVNGPSVPAELLRSAPRTLSHCSVIIIKMTMNQFFERAALLDEAEFDLWDMTTLCYYDQTLWQFEAIYVKRSCMRNFSSLQPMRIQPFRRELWQSP